MKAYLFLLINLSLLTAQTVKSQEYELFGNPENFVVLTDSTVMLYDPDNTNQEVCVLNLKYKYFDQEKLCIRKGRGPGEVSTLALRFFNNQKDQEIYIWDGGNKNLNVYSYNLSYKRTIRRPDFGKVLGARYRIPLPNGDEYISTFKKGSFGYYYSRKEDTLINLPIESDLIEPAKSNPLYLQGDYDVDWDSGSLVFVTEYSSVILKIKNKATECVTLGEPKLEFPENDIEDGFAIPRMSTYTFSSLDVSIKNNKIFVLHSGKKPTKRKTIWYELRDKLDEYADQLLESKTVLVYNLENCSYEKTLELSRKAIRAKVHNQKVFSLVRNKEDSALIIEDFEY